MSTVRWLDDYRADVQRYRRYTRAGTLRVCLTQQGLWALFQYRLARAAYLRGAPAPVQATLYAWRKAVEVATGISLPCTASIGAGTYLNHFGPIIINNRAVIGKGCDISQSVTIGAGGHTRAGVPTIGDGVYIAPGAVVVGDITVGDRAGIGANCVVHEDIPSGAVVRPAKVTVKPGVKSVDR